ncbi:MAG: hypothetical protein GXP45_03450 [bacterium]|nr:hypothetical protein [bacterium]
MRFGLQESAGNLVVTPFVKSFNDGSKGLDIDDSDSEYTIQSELDVKNG